MIEYQEAQEGIADAYYGFTVKKGWALRGFESEIREESYKFAERIGTQLAHCTPILIERGKKEERERILGMMNKRDVGGVNPEWALSDAQYQALKRSRQ